VSHSLSSFEDIRKGWGGNVEFVVKNRQTDKILLVVEVKQTLTEKKALWQMLSELAIAARHNQGKAFGALTNGTLWVFFEVNAHELGFDIRMSDQQQLYMNPIGVAESTVKALQFMCQAIFPEKSSLSPTDVKQALVAIHDRSNQLVRRATDEYLGSQELRAEANRLRQRIAQLVSERGT